MKEYSKNLNKIHIDGLQNYYEAEAGIIPSEEDIQETINKLTRDRIDKDIQE